MGYLDKKVAQALKRDRPAPPTRSRSAKVVFTRDGNHAISRDPIGAATTVYSVWEPSHVGVLRLRESPLHRHGTVRSFEGGRPDVLWWGRLSTRNLPDDLERLPPLTEQRAKLVRKWRASLEKQSYKLIEWAFPETSSPQGHRSNGEIVFANR